MVWQLFEMAMRSKVGAQWLQDRRVRAFADLQNADGAIRAVVLWHGDVDGDLKAQLRNRSHVCALLVGENPPPSSVVTDADGGTGRAHTLEYGVKHKEDRRWVLDRLEAFVESLDTEEGEPKWELLAPPRAPEHVIACLLCALGRIDPDEEWRSAFEDEVGWRNRDGGQINLTWNAHRSDVAALREFLNGW